VTRFLEIAAPLAERGFRVFPLAPRQKIPLKMSWGDHFDAATTDIATLQQWDREVPVANLGISPDENFCFLETDDEAGLRAECSDVPAEVWDTARVSARPNRCYYIFRQTMRTRKAGNMTKTREGRENLFEFKQHRVYVTGPGSIHPKTGKPYNVEWRTIPAMPDVLLNRLCELNGAPKASESHAMTDETRRQTETLDGFLAYYELPTLGDWFNKGKQWYRPIVCPWEAEHENSNQGTSTCIVYTEAGPYGFDCKHRCAGKSWKEFRAELESRFPNKAKFRFVETGQAPEVTIGGVVAEPVTPVPLDWRLHYHTRVEVENAPKPEFLIEGFLQRQSIVGIAGFVAHKKSLIALNVCHSLCTGEPLFGKFRVARKAKRVLYLCPEMGLIGFSDRVRKIGLMPYVGDSFFCATMSLKDGVVRLPDLTREEINEAVIFVDTAIRFIDGDENSSQHMKELAAMAFTLIRDGAECVVFLCHSSKTMVSSGELTLENSMRGSGELSAFLFSCWATRMQDPEDAYDTPNLLKQVKSRDFESKPFEVTTSRETCRMTFVEGSEGAVVIGKSKKADADGKEDIALQVIRDNPKLSIRKLAAKMKDLGIKRSPSWVGNKRFEVLGVGVKTS
jgi:Bifunctional DNA primase/polymerase, N-terminal/AAA domain